MSLSTVVNALPEKLRVELKMKQMYAACFTDARRKTVRDSHSTMVLTGITKMIRNRQELLLANFSCQAQDAVIEILCDIEVLRYTMVRATEEL